jgi:molybdopterin molybdotransferase
MLSVSEAKQTILAAVNPLPARPLPLAEALGCILAEDLVSPLSLPAWDNSAVDGYAVRSSDIALATGNNPMHLRVIAEVPAGAASSTTLEPLTCARIFTGAPVPGGADAVVMQEDTRLHHEGYVAILASVDADENIRHAGDDVQAGQTILRAGMELTPARLGLAAAVGMTHVPAHPRPRVGVLVTGAEIVEPGRALGTGQIYDSNSYTLNAWLRGIGCEPVELGIADDTREDLHEKIDYGLSECDAVITVGGVSVGEYDLVKDVLTELGCELSFWKVAMKPGKPFVFGTRPDRLVFGLPGNPVSAAVTFLILVRPALMKLRGLTDWELPVTQAEAAEEFVNRGDRAHFVRVRLTRQGEKWLAAPLPRQGSHVISSLANADGLVEVPPDGAIHRGNAVSVLRV